MCIVIIVRWGHTGPWHLLLWKNYQNHPHMLKSCLYNTFSFLLPLPYAAVPDDPQIRGCSVFSYPPIMRNPKTSRKAARRNVMPEESERNAPEHACYSQKQTLPQQISARFVFFSDRIWRDVRRKLMYSNNCQEEPDRGIQPEFSWCKFNYSLRLFTYIFEK